MLAIAERRAKPKAERFYRPYGTDRVFCIISQSAAADAGLLSLSPSLLRPPGYGGQAGTSPQRSIRTLKLTCMDACRIVQDRFKYAPFYFQSGSERLAGGPF
jgi:hypothetical protein